MAARTLKLRIWGSGVRISSGAPPHYQTGQAKTRPAQKGVTSAEALRRCQEISHTLYLRRDCFGLSGKIV